jgi:hypothetical protein
MQKLIPVEEAKALMAEAQDWSMWSWMAQKGKLRSAADLAWEALDEAEEKVRASWSDPLARAWREVEALAAADGRARSHRQCEKAVEEARAVGPEIKTAVQKVKEADLGALSARIQAEDTFDEAEKRMSTSMACEGARQAIAAWELREKLVRKLESLGRKYTL